MNSKKNFTHSAKVLMLGALFPLVGNAQNLETYDIGGASGDGNPKEYTELNGLLYFNGTDPVVGSELMAYDPATNSVTTFDLDPTPSVFSSGRSPKYMVTSGGKLYYAGYDNSVGIDLELYEFDPATGTDTKIDIDPVGSSDPRYLIAASNGMIYMNANVNGDKELYEYNTSSGAITKYDLNPGTASSFPKGFCENDGVLYFTHDGPLGKELYGFNTTTKEESLVWDIEPSGNSLPSNLTAINGKIYGAAFRADDYELIIYDPATGTGDFINVDPNQTVLQGGYVPSGSSPSNFIEYNGDIYFTAFILTEGQELMKLDGQTGQTSIVYDTNPGGQDIFGGALYQGYSGSPTDLVLLNDKLYFSAYSPGTVGGDDRELFEYDLVTGAGKQTMDLFPGLNQWGGQNQSSPKGTVVFNDQLFFSANTAEGNELNRIYWCPEPESVLPPAGFNTYKFYLAHYIYWQPSNHPNLVGYNVYSTPADGSPTTVEFVAAVEGENPYLAQFAPSGPVTINYEIKTVIETQDCGQIEGTASSSASISYQVVEPQCNIGGLYELEYEWVGYWQLNVYKFNNFTQSWFTFAQMPLGIDQLFWCITYGGTPIETTSNFVIQDPELIFGIKESALTFEETVSIIENGGVTAINEVSVTGFNIYPNPATDILNIVSESVISQVKVVDALGRTHVAITNPSKKIELNISTYTSGIYIIEITNEKGETSFEKVMIK